VSDVDFKQVGYINVIKEGGKIRPEQKYALKSKQISLDSSGITEEPSKDVKKKTREFLRNLK